MKLTRSSFWQKQTAIFLSFSLTLFNSVSFATPFTQPQNLNQPENNSSAFSIPESFGRIEESFAGDPNKTIVYIQDAHDSLEAQENIARIINHFVERYGVKTVFEEGYEGPVPTDEYFGFIKDPRVKEKVSYFLMDKLRLGGAEYAHINRTKDFKLIGADSIKLHLENISWYQKMAEHKEETVRDLEAIFTEIKKLTNRYFPKELKDWLKLKRRFDEHTLNLLEYLKRTKSLWLKSVPETEFQTRYPTIDLLLSAEDTKDKEVIESVKEKGTGRKSLPVPFSRLQALDPKTLLQEIDRLENDYARIHLTTARDQKIFGYYKGLQLLKRLGDIQLSSEEYEVAKTIFKELRTEELAQFLAETTKKSTVLSKRWEESIQNAIKFYETAQSRDGTIERHLDQFIERPDESTAVLVFGGFHKNQITEILKRKGISHLIVSPRIAQLDGRHKDYYRELMSVGHLPFEIPMNVSRASRVANFYERAGNGTQRLAKSELRIISEAVKRGLNLDFPILDQQIMQRLTTLKDKTSKDVAFRSEVRVTVQGPDGPIEWEVSEAAKDIMQRLEWNVSIEEGSKEIHSKLQSFDFDYHFFFEDNPEAFFWILDHISDPRANLTTEERNLLFEEIVTAIESYPVFKRLEVFALNEDQLEAWWYLLVRLLVLQHNLSQRPAEDELTQKHIEFVQDIYRLALGEFKDALERGFAKQNIKQIFEPRLYQLAKLQPSLRGPIGELLQNWDTLADESSQVEFKWRKPEEEETPSEGLTTEKLREMVRSVVTSASRQQWVAQQLLKLRDVLTPRTEEAIEMWDHSIEYMKKSFGSIGTIFLDTSHETNLKYKTSTGELPTRWKFRLVWFDQMGQLGFKQWAITSSLQYIQAFHKAYIREEEQPTIQHFVELLEEYLKNPKELPLREHLGLPTTGEETPEITGSLKFWKELWELKNRHKAVVTLFGALEFEHEDDPNDPYFRRFDEWLEKTKGSRRLILGSFPPTSFEKDHDRIGAYSDPSIARIDQVQALEDYHYEAFSYSASMAHIPYQIGQARGWGDHQAASFLIRNNQTLRDFFQEKNGPEDFTEAIKTHWWPAVIHFGDDYRVFNMKVVISESEEEEQEEPWVPEEEDVGVKGPKELAPSGVSPAAPRSEVRVSLPKTQDEISKMLEDESDYDNPLDALMGLYGVSFSDFESRVQERVQAIRSEVRISDKEIANAFHFYGNEDALQLWIDDISSMSGKSHLEIKRELAEIAKIGKSPRYGEIPEERWIYLLPLAKLASESSGLPIFMERGTHLYGALWPELRDKLKQLGISLPDAYLATKLAPSAQKIIKEYSPDRPFFSIASSVLKFFTEREKKSPLSSVKKSNLLGIWNQLPEIDKERINNYLKQAWKIGSFQELLERNGLTTGEFVTYLGDAGVAPDFVLTQFRFEQVVKILMKKYERETIEKEGLPTYQKIRQAILEVNESLHPLTRFEEDNLREIDEIFKETGLDRGTITRDSENFFTSTFWRKFVGAFSKRHDKGSVIRNPDLASEPLLIEALKDVESIRVLQGRPFLIYEDAVGTGGTLLLLRLIARVLAPGVDHKIGAFISRWKQGSPDSWLDFMGNYKQVFPYEDRPEFYDAFYRLKKPNGIQRTPSITRTTYDSLRKRWESQAEKIPNKERLHKQYVTAIERLIEVHGESVFGGLDYLPFARKSAEFDLKVEVIKAYLRGGKDILSDLLQGFFTSYTGELSQINWEYRSKIGQNIQEAFSRLKSLEREKPQAFSRLRELKEEVDVYDKSVSMAKFQKAQENLLERQRNALVILNDSKIVESVKDYFQERISFDALRKRIMTQGNFKQFLSLNNGVKSARRSELRDAVSSIPSIKWSDKIENLEGRFTVFVDLADIGALTDGQFTEDYEKTALRHKNVSFVFYNAEIKIDSEKRERLEKLQEQLGSHRIQIAGEDARSVFSRQWVGELIHVSKRRGRAADLLTSIPRIKGLHRFRYLGDETGVVPVALLYVNQDNKGFENKIIDLSMVDERLIYEVLAYQASLVFARSA